MSTKRYAYIFIIFFFLFSLPLIFDICKAIYCTIRTIWSDSTRERENKINFSFLLIISYNFKMDLIFVRVVCIITDAAVAATVV